VAGAAIGVVMFIGFFQHKFGNTMMKIWDIKMILMDLAFVLPHDASEKGLVSAHNSSLNFQPSITKS